MNIFVLDYDPVIAAEMQFDKHVVKMTLESAQLLCTVVQERTSILMPYKSTHVNHPCTLWAGSSWDNWFWLYKHFKGLLKEYQFRYNKVHLCQSKILNVLKPKLKQIKNSLPGAFTPFAQAMPTYCKDKCAVEAYRKYYVQEKAGIAEWNKSRRPPYWWPEYL